jgi:hypothetical protein
VRRAEVIEDDFVEHGWWLLGSAKMGKFWRFRFCESKAREYCRGIQALRNSNLQ